MKIQLGPIEIATGKDAQEAKKWKENAGKIRPISSEEMKRILESREKDSLDYAMGVPSSAKGRDLYYSELGLFDVPFMLVLSFWDRLVGNDVWYSDRGTRCVKTRMGKQCVRWIYCFQA